MRENDYLTFKWTDSINSNHASWGMTLRKN